MPRNFITTNSFNAVAPGQKATLSLSVGGFAYHGLLLTYGTATAGGPTRVNMEAELTQIALKINGKEQRVFSAAQLFAINEVNGIAFAPGFLPIFFSEPWRRTVVGEDGLGWGTGDVATFTVEVDIDAGATSPTLEARALVDRTNRPLGPIVKWRRFTVPVSATGIVNVTTLPKSDAYYRLHAFSTLIDDVEVKVDQVEVFKATDAQMRELYAEQGLSVPAALTSIIFDATQRVGDALPMFVQTGPKTTRPVSEFRVDYNMNTATSFTLITETVGERD
jgi:hypothetical protein